MPIDANDLRSPNVDVCCISVHKSSMIHLYQDLAKTLNVSLHDINVWSYIPEDSFSELGKLDMPISNIPCEPDFRHPHLSARFAQAFKFGFFTGEKNQIVHCQDLSQPDRPISDFKYFVLEEPHRLTEHAYLEEIILANPSAVVLTSRGQVIDHVHFTNLTKVRRKMETLLRNTGPLLNRAQSVSVGGPGRQNQPLLTALDVQVLLRASNVGLSYEDHKQFFASLRLLKNHHLIQGNLYVHRYVQSDIRLLPAGEAFIQTLHPSAYDPGFLDRWRTWISEPDAHTDQEKRWVRTWSGRLRRHQARIWKESVPPEHQAWIAERANALISEGVPFFLQDVSQNLSGVRPDIGPPQTVAALIMAHMNSVPKTVFDMRFATGGDKVYGPPDAFL